MSRGRPLVLAFLVLVTVTSIGVTGYAVIEGAGFLDALYMTVITISTVGFAEVFELSDAGRIFTVILIIVGVGGALYTAGTAVEIAFGRLLGGEMLRRRMQRLIDGLDDHVIVCGFGRVGRNTWRALRDEGIEAVVIEQTEDAAERALAEGANVIEGDATRDDTLAGAGIDRARALIACVQNDNDNLVIVLSAKHRRRDLPVIARATELEAQEKLRLAGADRVVSPQLVGAHRLAALAAEPRLDEFVDVILHGKLVELRIEGFEIYESSPLAGVLLRDSDIRAKSGAMVLAIETSEGDLQFNPDPSMRIEPGQMVIGIGTNEQIEAMQVFLS